MYYVAAVTQWWQKYIEKYNEFLRNFHNFLLICILDYVLKLCQQLSVIQTGP